MKLMIAPELESTGEAEISLFQRLSLGKGTKPFRFAPWPRPITLQSSDWPPPPVPPLPPPPLSSVPEPPPQPHRASTAHRQTTRLVFIPLFSTRESYVTPDLRDMRR